MEPCRPVEHSVCVNGPVIIGAGPSGLATAACFREQGIPFVVLERADCIASLWQNSPYYRLKLHLPKQFCQLPKLPFARHFLEYPTQKQFIEYFDSYAKPFEIKFNESVQSARYDETSGLWRVKTVASSGSTRNEVEYVCRWLVSTGENAERVMPEIELLSEFKGDVIHARDYPSGETSRRTPNRRKKGSSWTEEEHRLFLEGLRIHGKGAWKRIANVVRSKNRTQVASHAQKYFLRNNGSNPKKRSSIHDVTEDSLNPEPPMQQMIDIESDQWIPQQQHVDPQPLQMPDLLTHHVDRVDLVSLPNLQTTELLARHELQIQGSPHQINQHDETQLPNLEAQELSHHIDDQEKLTISVEDYLMAESPVLDPQIFNVIYASEEWKNFDDYCMNSN